MNHARDAGELLLKAKSGVAHGAWLPWLAENCPAISPRCAQNYMRIAGRWDELRTKTKRDSDLPLREGISLLRKSKSVEWYSPERIIEAARTVLGDIDLDPASCPAANRTVRASRFFTLEDDGLHQDWPGRVWLNPPYGGEARKFVEHLRDQLDQGITTAAVLLTSAVPTGDAWFQRLIRERRPICFIGRVRYTNAEGVESPSMHASAVVYFEPEPEQFRDVFEEGFAPVIRRW